MFGKSGQPDMGYVGEILSAIGLQYEFDGDGDITFTMRLPGVATRQADGSPDWSPLRYSMQQDFTIDGEFTDMGQHTDLAKRVVRIYLVGSNSASGGLVIHAYPRVVPAKFEHSGHIRVVPTEGEAEEFNNSERSGLHAKHFDSKSFGLIGSLQGTPSEDSLRDTVGYAMRSAGRFMEGRFSGLMVADKA